ncbi:hypothetical protein D3C71_1598620 [compost metagenome]
MAPAYFNAVKACAEVARIRPTLVALMAATTNAPEAIPRIPGSAPAQPWRRALDSVRITPGPGLKMVRVAKSKKSP